jgi:hypothetical protein
MKLHPWAMLAAMALGALPAHSDCSSVQMLKAIDGGGDTPEDSFHKSNFKLPNAKSCFLYISSPRLSSITCEWPVAQGMSNKAEAVRTYEILVQSMLQCVSRPETLERAKVQSKQGERASILDTFSGMRPTQQRAFEVSYGYRNYWWTVELEYEVNDEVGQ